MMVCTWCNQHFDGVPADAVVLRRTTQRVVIMLAGVVHQLSRDRERRKPDSRGKQN
jgi:hypothetical protein